MRDPRTLARYLVLVLLFAGGSVTPGLAQRPMTLVDLLNVPQLTDPQLSPDGQHALYVFAEADWATNRRISHVWRISIDGSDNRQMTRGHGESAPRWSPDGQTIAFLGRTDEDSNGDADTQIHLLSNDGGEARRLTGHATSTSSPTWSPDGRYLYFIAPDPKSEEQEAREEAEDDVYAFDEDYQQRHLWRVAVSSGAETRVTEGDFSVIGYELSADGSRLAVQKAPNPLFGDAEEGEVWVIDVTGGGQVELTDNGMPEGGAALSPDNRQVLFLADANGQFENYYNQNLFVVPASGGPSRDLTSAFPHEVQRAAWSRDGESIYFVANTGVRSELFRVAAAGGEPTPITRGDHAIDNWQYVPGLDRHVFTVDEPRNPGDIWVLSGDATEPERVSHVFDFLATDYALPRQEAVQWEGADGATVEGLVFYPLEYEAGQRYPLVVQTHGGPASSDRFGFGSWGSYVPVLTARGYVVFKPNYRGSTGYGDAFLRDMVGSYFKNSHLDVMTGVDHLIALGIADPDRMVKMGWSGGGHMTNKIITFTDRFKAASSGAGASNWISMYAQSDVRTYRTPWFGGTPWQEQAPIDLYWEHSPLREVYKVTTPTLFLVGEEDVRVPMPQSVEMYRALESLGVPTHLYVAPREPHGWQELRHQLFKMNVELAWFEQWATERPYTWEKAPVTDEPAEDTPED